MIFLMMIFRYNNINMIKSKFFFFSWGNANNANYRNYTIICLLLKYKYIKPLRYKNVEERILVFLQ